MDNAEIMISTGLAFIIAFCVFGFGTLVGEGYVCAEMQAYYEKDKLYHCGGK